jgi:FkbH-like protein
MKIGINCCTRPKSDNLRRIAATLNLGLDSIVFADDNPAEIDIVRQFAPAVSTLWLGPDPAEYASRLRDCRFFEPQNITAEDASRTEQYHADQARQSLEASVTDMDAYLDSLQMEATLAAFDELNAPRLAQLINKSNQFNLTTRRRTESEVRRLVGSPSHITISVRLRDRFGDNGLISAVIGAIDGDCVEIDTWLMSCRVLKRQVEETVLNELAHQARLKGCRQLRGLYLATLKNGMVRDFYSRLGFETVTVSAERGVYTLLIDSFRERPTKIKVLRHAHDAS